MSDRFIWRELKAGRITAKRFGERTVILEEEALRYARSAPDADYSSPST